MVKVIIAFIIADFVLSFIRMYMPLFTWNGKKWQEQSHFQRFSNGFFPVLIGFLICLFINYYQEINNPTSYEQMLIDGDAEYFVVFGDEYVGDADIALEISRGHSPEKICKIIARICKEDYVAKGGDALNVFAEGENYVIMDGDVQIGNVDTVDRKFGVVLRFYWK